MILFFNQASFVQQSNPPDIPVTITISFVVNGVTITKTITLP